MSIVVNLEPLIEFFNLPFEIFLWQFFIMYGWIPLALAFIWGAKEVWVKNYIQPKWFALHKQVLLAIDIPRGNEQSPKAVENLFSYIGGAHKPPNLIEKYWVGEFVLSISFEIVSIEGYTQFLVRTPDAFRPIVETAVYSQYPDAEIYEVTDYTVGMPKKFPDDEYDAYGFEVVPVKNSAYPIRTYTEFEHLLGEPETHYKDSMALLMDLCSSLKRGEQFWYQIIIRPTSSDWSIIGDKEFGKIIGKKDDPTRSDNITSYLMRLMHDFSEFVYRLWDDIDDKKENDDLFNTMKLTPKQKYQVEAVQKKTDKQGFEAKQRFVYIAKKDAMNKPKVGYGFIGYIKQFNLQDLNSLKPDFDYSGVSAHYVWRQSRLNNRKTSLVNNFMNRDIWAGTIPVILNTEELATLWHFPHSGVVKAPLIQKAPGRKAEPPMALPVGNELPTIIEIDPIFKESSPEKVINSKNKEISKLLTEAENELAEEIKDNYFSVGPPPNLPVI